MRKNLLAKSIATMIGGFALVGVANAVVAIDPNAPVGVPAARTLEVNTDAIGHSLLFPYYSAQGEQVTTFSITNTDTLNGKAVKVRFRGAENSDDVYDITVLMSPGDVWNANVTRQNTGTTATTEIASLSTRDRSCTLPQEVGTPPTEASMRFNNFIRTRLTGTGQTSRSTLEGYIEVFNMADIPPTTAAGAVNPLFTAIKHGTNGVPADCNAVAVNGNTATQGLFLDPVDGAQAEGRGLGAPTTGLTGVWTILNGPQALAFSGEAVAIEAREIDGGRPGYGNIVFFPQDRAPVGGNPAIGTGTAIEAVRAYTADPILRGGVVNNTDPALAGTAPGAPPVPALMFDFPDMSTPYLNEDITAAQLVNGRAARRQAYRLSRSLAVSSIMNEFVTASGLNALTDWTVSSPSRRYNVARNYTAGTGAGSTLYTDLSRDDTGAAVGTVIVPGGLTLNPTNYYTPANTTVTLQNANMGSVPYGVICTTGNSFVGGGNTVAASGFDPQNLLSGVILDREESAVGTARGQFVASPGDAPPPDRALCGEVSVVSFNQGPPTGSTTLPPSVLNGQLTRFDVTTVVQAGWARFATPGLAVASGQGLGFNTVVPPATSTRAGLPIIGNAFIQYTNLNAQAGGANARTVGNYEGTYKHRATRY